MVNALRCVVDECLLLGVTVHFRSNLPLVYRPSMSLCLDQAQQVGFCLFQLITNDIQTKHQLTKKTSQQVANA